MYYRRKTLLALLQVFNNRLEKIRLQKLLFLLAQLQKENAAYNFVPYKFGCFSFQANADLGTLKKYGMVTENNNCWIKEDNSNFLNEIKTNDAIAIKTLHNIFGKMTTDDLISYTYKNYPFYAINSTITEKHVTSKVIKRINDQKSKDTESILFTIGYEGISLEEYLNKLLRNSVKVLCDVRKNALSMKYGFSKKQLQNACEGTGIKYIHYPDVGIVSENRKNLNTQKDYDRLFEKYKKENLPNTLNTQKQILKIINKQKRIALTCFEANIHQCHRKHLGESIIRLSNSNLAIKHI